MTFVDGAVYLAVGLAVGLLLAVVVGRGQLPKVSESPLDLS